MNDYDIIDDPSIKNINYPCIVLEGILVSQQFTGFLKGEYKGHTRIYFTAYGKGKQGLVYLGELAMTAENLAKLQYMDIDMEIFETDTSVWKIKNVEDLYDFCTFIRG